MSQAWNPLWENFETEMLPHRRSLYQTAKSLLRGADDAEDVVQETYLQAWKSVHRFEPGTNSRAWLFGILYNVIRHHRRRWRIRYLVTEDSQTLENTLAAPPEISDRLEDKEVLTALAGIPPQYSEMIMMADVEELEYHEIAEARAIPIGTVMSRVSRGRALLRAKLGHAASRMGIHRSELAAA